MALGFCLVHLARQLLELWHATLDMWRAMRQHHEAQSLFAQQLRGLSSRTSMDPTTEIHHQATRALEAAMNAWSAAMSHMAKHQRDYVHAIGGGLKLTLTPVNGAADAEAEASPVAAELAAFVDRWGEGALSADPAQPKLTPCMQDLNYLNCSALSPCPQCPGIVPRTVACPVLALLYSRSPVHA